MSEVKEEKLKCNMNRRIKNKTNNKNKQTKLNKWKQEIKKTTQVLLKRTVKFVSAVGVHLLTFFCNSFGLFLQFQMFCFASCLCGVNFCGRSSMELSVLVSLISLSGCFSVALSFICVGSLLVLGVFLLVATFLVGSPLQKVYW